MARVFLTGNDVRFTAHDKIFVDAELFSGEIIRNLEPRRLFPVTGGYDYITFLDEEGEEKFILRRVAELPDDQRAIIEGCLFEYYRIPKITSIIEKNESALLWVWVVDTDRGRFTFEMNNAIQGIKHLYDGRVLLTDSKDNRYEIPDVNKLDARSYKMIQLDL